MNKIPSSVVGGVLGVVLLALVAVFGIFLPKAESNASTETSVPALPDRVGGLVALDSPSLPASLKQRLTVPAAQVRKLAAQASKGLERIYDKPARYRLYVTSDGANIATVTVLGAEPGLFAPDGPPVPSTGRASSYQLAKVGGAVCAEYTSQSATTQSLQPGRSHCQLGVDGRTYDIDAQGVSARQAVAALKTIAHA